MPGRTKDELGELPHEKNENMEKASDAFKTIQGIASGHPTSGLESPAGPAGPEAVPLVAVLIGRAVWQKAKDWWRSRR
jgi:hypothetical protein